MISLSIGIDTLLAFNFEAVINIFFELESLEFEVARFESAGEISLDD